MFKFTTGVDQIGTIVSKKKISQCLKNDNIFKKFKSSNQDFFWLCIRNCSLCLSMFHSTTLTKYAYCICEQNIK